MIGGIYKIIDTRNNNFYIGSAKSFPVRKSDHFWKLERGIHPNKHLQHIYNLYGKDILEFIPILICDTDNLLLYEQLCIDGLKPQYNECPTAGSCLGRKHSEETKRKIGLKHKGKVVIKPSYMLGVPKSKDIRDKISKSLKGRHAQGRPKGIPCTEDHKKYLSERLTGIKRSDETKKRMSLAQKNHKVTDEARKNMSIAQIKRRINRLKDRV